MFSRPVPGSLSLCVFASILLLGCRGTYPLARSVQVTHDPSLEVPAIEAPPQRLATAKPRAGSELGGPDSTRSDATRSDVTGPVTRASGTRDAASQRVSTMGFEASPPLDDRGFVREGNTQVESRPSSASPAPRSDSAQFNSAPLPPDAGEMLEAFKNSPPEVQQLALRQLAAAASRTTAAVAAPSAPSRPGVDAAAASDSIRRVSYDADSLAGVVASINHVKTGSQGHIESLTDRPTSPKESTASEATASESTGAALSLSHSSEPAQAAPAPVPAPSGPIAVTIAESDVKSTLSAPIAIAAAKPTPPTQIAQPIPTSTEPFQAAAPSPTPVSVASAIVPAKASAASMSEAELYSELLGRLGKGSPDESDAERSRRLVMLRHLMVLSGKVDEAVRGVDGMPEKEQEYLRHQLLGLWTIIDPDGHPVPGRRFSAALPQLREATNQLAAATDTLDVRSLAFCTEIEAYGQIKKFPSSRFKTGQQVILYCEIDNFVAAKIPEGYETNLQGSYDIYNEAGAKMASQLLPTDRQVSNNYLRDYFIAYQMFLPKELAAGKYRMQLTIEDLTGKKYGQATIAFEMIR